LDGDAPTSGMTGLFLVLCEIVTGDLGIAPSLLSKFKQAFGQISLRAIYVRAIQLN
jgi:hypothetical protein